VHYLCIETCTQYRPLELSSSETHSETRANYSRCHVQLRILDCDSEYSYYLLPQLPILKPVK